MPSTRVLRIWGVPLRVDGVDNSLLSIVINEFAGATSVIHDDTDDVYCFTVVSGPTVEANHLPERVRHLGGSSGNKRFLSGETFYAASQDRRARVVSEDRQSGTYILDGCVVVTTGRRTIIVGDAREKPVLPDLIEAYLLDQARKAAWLQCHGACWVESGRAYLAVGPSGAGKTTQLLSKLGSGCTFLGNDRVFLRLFRGQLEVRGYPLAMNVGTGTIRALQLDLPDFGGSDSEKIRLTPSDVAARLAYDYETWWPVAEIAAPSENDLLENLYVTPDPCHPRWNAAWQAVVNPSEATAIVEAARHPSRFRKMALRATA
jgi:hypothetical protein